MLWSLILSSLWPLSHHSIKTVLLKQSQVSSCGSAHQKLGPLRVLWRVYLVTHKLHAMVCGSALIFLFQPEYLFTADGEKIHQKWPGPLNQKTAALQKITEKKCFQNVKKSLKPTEIIKVKLFLHINSCHWRKVYRKKCLT